jgi:deoxyribonuclease-4
MSIAGGVDKAPARAASVGCTAMQIFVKNNNRWEGPPISDESAARFPGELAKAGIRLEHVFAHSGYLINLASPKEDVLAKSIVAVEDELRRCGQLALPGLVLHPGAHLGTGRDAGIEQIARHARAAIDATPEVVTRILFETTAGQGTTIGERFEDLRDILAAVDRPDRTGVCLDTCHIFAAGHDIRTPEAYKATMKEFDKVVGLGQIRAFHLNDSKFPLGKRKDRHEHIGQGEIGEEGFRCLLTDKRFAKIPMCLETDKDEKTLDEDRMNLAVLRRLAGEKPAK